MTSNPFPQINLSAAKKRRQNLSTPNLSFKRPLDSNLLDSPFNYTPLLRYLMEAIKNLKKSGFRSI